jgi:hypothetical protein
MHGLDEEAPEVEKGCVAGGAIRVCASAEFHREKAMLLPALLLIQISISKLRCCAESNGGGLC